MNTSVEVATTIDLLRFCGEGHPRCRMDVPFVKGGWLYATDGRVVVRIPAAGQPDTPRYQGHSEFPPAADLFQPQYRCEVPWPPSSGMVREVSDCPQCEGNGVVWIGDEYDGFEDMESRRCLACNGRKKFIQDVYCPVGLHNIRADFFHRIASLPSVRYAAGVDPGPKFAKALPFAFDGGEGRVMGFVVE